MGLDMYLFKVRKYGDATLNEILETRSYVEWMKRPLDKYADRTPEDWNGCNAKLVRHDLLGEIRNDYTTRYWIWDDEHKYPYEDIEEEVAYWRKANAIHNWFVNNVQEGVDDCGYYKVTRDQLKELLRICHKVMKGSHLVDGKVYNGTTWTKETGEVENWEDGKVIDDPFIAEKLLPTTSGFFFGSTSYDQVYYEDIKNTIEQITKILNDTDFNNWIVYYHSSW